MAIISFKHNFIFIKTTKTAGTSVEIELGKIAGAGAIVTPILPEFPGHHPRNFTDISGAPVFYNHMPATEIRQLLGADRFASMFKFCVEREPVSKCISQYHMNRNSPLHNPGGRNTQSWQEFCAAGKFALDHPKYSELRNGKPVLIVDRVLRYDGLPGTLQTLMASLGVDDFALQARAKSEYSQNTLVRTRDVTDAERRVIETAFQTATNLHKIDWTTPPSQDAP